MVFLLTSIKLVGSIVTIENIFGLPFFFLNNKNQRCNQLENEKIFNNSMSFIKVGGKKNPGRNRITEVKLMVKIGSLLTTYKPFTN